MRRYVDTTINTKKEEIIVCNKCGKKIAKLNDIWMEEVLQVNKEWGYFSKKDGREDSFDLCETCYDELVASFVVPIEIKEK